MPRHQELLKLVLEVVSGDEPSLRERGWQQGRLTLKCTSFVMSPLVRGCSVQGLFG